MVEVKRLAKGLCAMLGVVVGIVVVLLVVALVRALTLEDLDYQEGAIDPGERDHLPESYLKGLPQLMARALAIPTVAWGPGEYDAEAMKKFHVFLRESFPHVFNSSVIEVEVVNEYSLLLSIKGLHDDLVPYMLTGHIDVVPVAKDKWTHDPWGGHILKDSATGESYIWGRGALDNKAGVMGIMMALEYLAKTDFQPERSFYVAFGHDEEVRGLEGAGHIAKVLESRGVQLDFILDEGMPVLKGVVNGVEEPVALIGVSEKGWVTVELEVEGPGGHSSIPPANSAVTRLAKAIVALEDNPQPSMFGQGPEADMLAYLAPKASWPFKMIYSNLWLFGPLVSRIMAAKRETNAVTRTTTSVTIVRAGVKDNVVPATATAVVNHRVHPAQSIRDVIQHDRKMIADPSVKINLLPRSMEAHPVSPYGPEVSPWRLLSAAVRHHYPNAITAPSVLIANTDTRHYLQLTPHVYRFLPAVITGKDVTMIHGHDEKISVTSLFACVGFYHHLILAADVQSPPLKTQPGHRGGEL